MSDAVADGGDTDTDPMADAETWQSLSREEQDEITDEGLARLKGDKGSGQFRHLSDREKTRTVDTVERGSLSETERAMQDALEQTFTAEVFQGLDDDEKPTIPFECEVLEDADLDKIREAVVILQQAEDEAETEADLDDFEVDAEHFDDLDDLDAWLPQFLADVTVDDGFDEQRWRSGERIVGGTRQQLLIEIVLHHEEEQERAQQFRRESSR